MKLREAYDQHYHKADLTRRSLKRFQHDLTRWEKLSGNPDVETIDNQTAERFRMAGVAQRLSPATINGTWMAVRAILRRLGPEGPGNPWGLGLIARVPAMRPVKHVRKLPRRVELDAISRCYIGAGRATAPRTGVPAADWWRCLLVVAYVTGLRRSDLFAIRIGDIDVERRELRFVAAKTGKGDTFPLHAAALAHLERLWSPDPEELLFRRPALIRGGRLYRYLARFQAAGERFRLHDLRRTGASEVERVRPGMGARFLQHSPRTVTDQFYVNAAPELRDAIDAMRLPVGFASGPKMIARADAKRRESAIRLDPREFQPFEVVPEEWGFRPGAFGFRGAWFRMTGLKLRALKALVAKPAGVTKGELAQAIHQRAGDVDGEQPVNVTVALLRAALRACFGLPRQFDPVPCIDRTRGHGPSSMWQLYLPADVGRA